MKVKYTYYWNEAKDAQGRHLGFFGFEEGHPLCIAYEGEVEIEADEDEYRICERLFKIFNTEMRPVAYRGPSMSVGSVILIGEVYMACYSIGWVNVDGKKSPIVPTPSAWRG